MPPSLQPPESETSPTFSALALHKPLSELIQRPPSFLLPLPLTSHKPHHARPRPLAQESTQNLRACLPRSWPRGLADLQLPSLLSVLLRSWKWFEYLWKLRTAYCCCYGHPTTTLTIFLRHPLPHSSPSLLQSVTLRPPPPGSLL